MRINEVSEMPVSRLIEYMEAISDEGYDVWIEGRGDGTIRLMVQSKIIYFDGDKGKN